jgi:hypothetical protein
MDQYCCRAWDLPSFLYRVQYPESQTSASLAGGLEAADTTTSFGPGELDEFRQAVQNHFTWGYRGRSPFISLFSDRNHAENWGRSQPWRGSDSHIQDWSLHAIDTSLLGETMVFKLSRLVEDLGVTVPERARQHEHGSYICLHRIPAQAIGQETNGDCELLSAPVGNEALQLIHCIFRRPGTLRPLLGILQRRLRGDQQHKR